MRYAALPLVALLLAGCSDKERAEWRQMTKSGHAKLTCWSGTEKIFDGRAKNLATEANTDGWNFYDSDGRWVRVSGACVAIYE